MVWSVRYHPEARKELEGLPAGEKTAMLKAVEKLELSGPSLVFPHQGAVRGAAGIRELRPRSGRSPWRGFYVRIGDVFVVMAVGPEAKVDPRRVARAVKAAAHRAAEVET